MVDPSNLDPSIRRNRVRHEVLPLLDAIAERGKEGGCLAWPPQWMPDPIGYICALTDPDGNMLEFSFDQGVYEKAQEVWG